MRTLPLEEKKKAVERGNKMEPSRKKKRKRALKSYRYT